MLSDSIFGVFGMTPPGIKPQVYRTFGEHSNCLANGPLVVVLAILLI